MEYGLIGGRLSHSFSPELHKRLADYDYSLRELSEGELDGFMRARDFLGINVTMPYKAAVIPYLDLISDEAKRLGSVNVIVNRGGRLLGYNTDIVGMRELILRSGVALSGKKVLILGTGGTARTAALAAEGLGASEILLVSRDPSAPHAESPIGRIIGYADAYSDHSDAGVIINATPVGMYPSDDTSPIDIDGFPHLEAVFDAIYNPLRTRLIRDALARGIYAEGGLYMLVSQAVHASALFLDARASEDATNRLYLDLLREKENIVLIGMPTSGKDTVGRILAEELHRELYITDDMIETKLGCTIAEYFERHTEAEFRELEHEVITECSARSGAVISTGGGCILCSENIDALRSCGRIYFIDRDLRYLFPSSTRPLARTREDIERLYRARYMLYRASCDVRINGNPTPHEVAQKIREDLFAK